MTENYEIDDLKRKVEDAKMKLTAEIKVTDFFFFKTLKEYKTYDELHVPDKYYLTCHPPFPLTSAVEEAGCYRAESPEG